MVKMYNVVLGIRSRLGDTDINKQRYCDAEIIDAVNSALAHLSEELLCFAREWVIPCIFSVDRYELPGDFLKLISVRFNGTLVDIIESVEHRLNKKGETCRFGVSLDMQTIHLFGSEIKETDTIELYYNYYETVCDDRDTIALPDVAKETIVYYALHLLYQNPNSSKGIEKSNYYYGMYMQELGRLRSRVRMNAQSRSIRSNFIKV